MRAWHLMVGVLLASLGPAGALSAQEAGDPLPDFRQMFLRLDTNGDTVIDRDEVPEAGLAAFETLLKYGDSDRNGRLELPELRALGQRVREAGIIPPAQILQRLRQADKDGDGKLSRSEFPGRPERFQRLDADGDGFLTRDEIARALGRAQADKPPTEGPKDQPGPRFKALDKNGDGKLSRAEFPGRPRAFERLDVDKDGSLSPEEARKWPGRDPETGVSPGPNGTS